MQLPLGPAITGTGHYRCLSTRSLSNLFVICLFASSDAAVDMAVDQLAHYGGMFCTLHRSVGADLTRVLVCLRLVSLKARLTQ